ncbi:hypothetical protein KD146_00005, partial [Devosia sp. BSSL-BM10]
MAAIKVPAHLAGRLVEAEFQGTIERQGNAAQCCTAVAVGFQPVLLHLGLSPCASLSARRCSGSPWRLFCLLFWFFERKKPSLFPVRASFILFRHRNEIIRFWQ